MAGWYGVAALFAFFVVCALWPAARRWWERRRSRAAGQAVGRHRLEPVKLAPDEDQLYQKYSDQLLAELRDFGVHIDDWTRR